jgi:RNA-dependent RNA polymerase
MTMQLAQMIFDGFMETQDPFMMSCLRLWRAWSIKYLKEKARIYVEHGAFVLGCVDETATLRGHFNDAQNTTTSPKDKASLPEIFLRIESPPSSGKWTVITGVCIIARNPSLHPGDVRVVCAVDKPELYHYRNCVVTPQTGDRDIPNMCSGGDLDGDDYLVIWDKDLLPEEWNHPAMNFEGAKPKESDGAVTVDDMTSFFVTYMRYDNLGRIAVAHRYWADARPEGVKDPKCLELANLHSTAVDYMKTGVPAKLPRHLRITQWPHWAEVKNKSKSKIYISKKVLGRLYDKVQRVDMQPQWDYEFDSRIILAYELDNFILDLARKAKQEYDAAVLRIMAKFSIKTEFEVWTTFVMEHASDFGDYKFAETIGEETYVLKDHHQQLCMEVVGTDKTDKEYLAKMGPFVAAMYTVSAQELDEALEECKKVKLVRGLQVPVREKTAATMPFISFPWLFPRELGIIANKGAGRKEDLAGLQASMAALMRKPKKPDFDRLGGDLIQEPLPEVRPSELSLYGGRSLDMPLMRRTEIFTHPIAELSQLPSVSRSMSPLNEAEVSAGLTSRQLSIINESQDNGVTDNPTANASTQDATSTASPRPNEDVERKVTKDEEEAEDEEDSGEVQQVTFPIEKSPLDALEALVGMGHE